jgi:hypothetical protein
VIQHFRERLTLLLLAALPLHALFITVSTKLIAGPNHAPLSWLSPWKEGVLGVILILAILEMLQKLRDTGHSTLDTRKALIPMSNVQCPILDVLDSLIILLIFWSVGVSVFLGESTGLLALGFRYDFLPLVAFLILRRVHWSDWFFSTLTVLIPIMAALLALYGFLTLALPESFFMALGYSDLHSLYLPDYPIAAFQMIEHSMLHRIQSTMSGPNQFGLWLLIPLAFLLSRKIQYSSINAQGNTQSSNIQSFVFKYWKLLGSWILILGCLSFTFSRSAWIAAFVMLCVAVWVRIERRVPKRVIVSVICALLFGAVVAAAVFPSAVLRLSSSRGHFERPLEAVHRMADHPWGSGLGAAGPASNRVSEACVMLRPEDDASWAKDRPDLCVFLGDKQVQPLDHACRCPLLTENWYLQIGVEAGFIGFFLYLALVIAVLLRLWKRHGEARSLIALLAFVGISIGALFLHAWEDTAVAWTAWMLVAFALQPRPRRGAAA